MDYIDKLKATHGDRYDYSKTTYVNSHEKIEIVCKEHGSFWQKPTKHRIGQGCPACAHKTRNDNSRVTFETFVEKAIIVHNSYYKYEKQIISGVGTKASITCPEHGEFQQSVESHLSGHGCTTCGVFLRGFNQRKTTENFVEEAKSLHASLYDYSLVDYQGAHKHVVIKCSKHGEFSQSPRNHLSGNGCPGCFVPGRKSKVADEWLDSIGIELREYRPPEYRRIAFDGYDPETNTAYLFHGDYWHGNPAIFKADRVNAHNKKTFGSLFEKTKATEDKIRGLGFNLVVMWEKDWRKVKAVKSK